MADLIDRANNESQAWLNEQIRQALQTPSNSPLKKGEDLTEYTECVDCGEPIGERRKQALPSAVRCIVCARKSEGQ